MTVYAIVITGTVTQELLMAPEEQNARPSRKPDKETSEPELYEGRSVWQRLNGSIALRKKRELAMQQRCSDSAGDGVP